MSHQREENGLEWGCANYASSLVVLRGRGRLGRALTTGAGVGSRIDACSESLHNGPFTLNFFTEIEWGRPVDFFPWLCLPRPHRKILNENVGVVVIRFCPVRPKREFEALFFREFRYPRSAKKVLEKS